MKYLLALAVTLSLSIPALADAKVRKPVVQVNPAIPFFGLALPQVPPGSKLPNYITKPNKGSITSVKGDFGPDDAD